MSDFKTALKSLAAGQIQLDSLSSQLSKILEKTPQFANLILTQLENFYAKGELNDEHYTELKKQINRYRRSHANQTETKSGDDEATVFDKDNLVSDNGKDDDNIEPTVAEGSTPTNENTASEDEATITASDEVSNTSTASFDITGAENDDGSEVFDVSALEPSGTSWSQQEYQAEAPETEIGAGSVIKQRFKLEKVLGVGGMGKVYKGLDLLKQEARDKRPHVAIKLLNESFKDHPEAFISLQRESSRQQKLAHPNIATIYDFDRVGGPGTPVYITMELMEGMELKDFIKQEVKPKNGIPFDEAFNIISQLVAALSYAHERGLVHSDFKPGNCFMCNDGTVKTLDFGIARAVKNPVTGEAEKTLFDPGKLGALTPAYASLEMLQGEEPDTRDDLYALGCVAYEVLTGKHPFNKTPADRAQKKNLVPPTIKGLKKKQNQALRRAVAFRREDRQPTVDEFLEELEAKYIWYKHPPTIAAVVLFAMAIGGAVPVYNYQQDQKVRQLIQDINQSNTVDETAQLIEKINTFKKTEIRTITDEAKDVIRLYLASKMGKYIDISGDNYNFIKAQEILSEINDFYPDSGFSEEQKTKLLLNQKQQLSLLYSQFSDALKDDASLPLTNKILHIIRTRVDSKNSLLTDPRPSNQYRELANNAFLLGNFDDALALIKSGLDAAPGAPTLLDLKGTVDRSVEILSLEEHIFTTRNNLVSLESYKDIEKQIIRLASLDRGNATLFPLAQDVQQYITAEVEQVLSSGKRADVEALAKKYEPLLQALQLDNELTQMKLAHLSGADRREAIDNIVAQNTTEIKALLEQPQLEDLQWETAMLANFQEMESLSLEDSSIHDDLSIIREAVAKLYVNKAKETLQEKRFAVADTFIDRGERFSPNYSDFISARNAIVNAKTEYEKSLQVDGLKQDFETQVAADQIAKALEYLEQLKEEIPNDNYLTTQAASMLSSSYARLAKSRFLENDFANALRLADEGLKLSPGNQTLRSDRSEYVVEANIAELNKIFVSTINFDVANVNLKISEIQHSPRFSEFQQEVIKLLQTRIDSLRTSNPNGAAALAQNAAIFFPGSVLEDIKNELKLQPWADAATASALLNQGKLTAANAALQAALEELPQHPDVAAFQDLLAINIGEANDSFNFYSAEKEAAGNSYEKLQVAKRLLNRAHSLWIDNPDYNVEEKELNKLIEANKPAIKKVIAREEINIDVATSSEGSVEKAVWKPSSSDRECIAKLAGYGKRARAQCFDLVNTGWRGPLMVVIPSGENFNNHFAISKYEISVGDYSKYCALSKRCEPIRDKAKFDEPMTGISLQEALTYAKWLSERTGKTYRLPTSAEWEYAANANGKQPKKDYNCRVALGDKIIKGTGIVSVKSGASNGWGLKNYVGNVQEWAVDGTGNIAVRGGAYEDAHSQCEISLQRSHNGAADKTTGFRLLLEEIG